MRNISGARSDGLRRPVTAELPLCEDRFAAYLGTSTDAPQGVAPRV